MSSKFGLKCSVLGAASVTALSAMLTVATPAVAATTLKAVMHSDVKIVDPIWTTAYITRNHGYMIYDTLFAQDAKNEVQPQMAAGYEVSADKLTYTIKLRDGLLFHDGAPVTAEDCIQSIKRWGAKDALGQSVSALIADMSAPDEKTIVIKLKEPTGLLIFALGKPSSNPAFIMPKRVALTDPNTQISDFTGSGPFVFKRDEWKPGDKTVYVKFDKYKPRSEPASGFAGGKVVNVDRVEWLAISDQQQAMNALVNGEIDYIEQPPHDLLPLVANDKNLKIVPNPYTAQYTLRFNATQPPFDNPKIRQAVWYALNQEDFLKATVGDAKYYKTCKSFFPCGTPMSTTAGMDGLLESNFAKSKALLKEAGYDGKPIVLMASTDLAALTNLSPVAKQLMEKGGFTIDMQSMDWQTLVSRRAKKDAWNFFHTAWVGADLLNPPMMGFMNAACDKALPGWPCDPELEKIRASFLRAPDLDAQKEVATAAQKRALEVSTHIPLGEYTVPYIMRKNIDGLILAPAPVFWNVTKK